MPDKGPEVPNTWKIMIIDPEMTNLFSSGHYWLRGRPMLYRKNFYRLVYRVAMEGHLSPTGLMGNYFGPE
jgi:hypothetical protein